MKPNKPKQPHPLGTDQLTNLPKGRRTKRAPKYGKTRGRR